MKYCLMEFWSLICSAILLFFSLPQIAQSDTSINLFFCSKLTKNCMGLSLSLTRKVYIHNISTSINAVSPHLTLQQVKEAFPDMCSSHSLESVPNLHYLWRPHTLVVLFLWKKSLTQKIVMCNEFKSYTDWL